MKTTVAYFSSVIDIDSTKKNCIDDQAVTLWQTSALKEV